MKCTLLFGAGAEKDFGLPLGNAFALKSIIGKKSGLQKALEDFFRIDLKRSDIFSGCNSVDFRTCILETVKYIKSISVISCFDKYVIDKSGKVAEILEDLSEDNKTNIQDLFNRIKNISEQELDNILDVKNPKSKIELICNYFTYKGSIERHFYSLIDKNINSIGYKKLFKYFWSSYFSILMPILKNTKKYAYLYSDYYGVLNKLPEIIHYIYSKESLIDNGDNYYKSLANLEGLNSVITTNYTPFAGMYFEKIDVNYLAGKLDLFENSEKNIIFKIDDIKKENIYFPFIMTQAPIKPIINSIQIKEYNNAIDKLDKSDYLIIIGYSLCDNDYHILSIIKEFLYKENKRIIYCDYCDENKKFDKERTLNDIKTNLRLDDKDLKKVIVLENNGNPEILCKRIKEKII